DTTAADALVRRFADQFWSKDWHGTRRPAVYFDPRSLEPEQSAVLHAKALVADSETTFITSANLTDAALNRNIELGVLLRDRTLWRCERRAISAG
ncbi:MAG: phospholipase, partial [Gammaproteobacteria bacterium]|nr:phospholipase [Gammaproteobacteria bacterium]